MVLDWLSSTFSNIKDRINNPILSIFTIIFVSLNWEILIHIIYYDNPDFYSKLSVLISGADTIKNLFIAILYSMGFNVTLNLSNKLLDILNSFIKPFLNNWLKDKQDLKTSFEELENELKKKDKINNYLNNQLKEVFEYIDQINGNSKYIDEYNDNKEELEGYEEDDNKNFINELPKKISLKNPVRFSGFEQFQQNKQIDEETVSFLKNNILNNKSNVIKFYTITQNFFHKKEINYVENDILHDDLMINKFISINREQIYITDKGKELIDKFVQSKEYRDMRDKDKKN